MFGRRARDTVPGSGVNRSGAIQASWGPVSHSVSHAWIFTRYCLGTILIRCLVGPSLVWSRPMMGSGCWLGLV